MNDPAIRKTLADGVMTLRMDRPAKKNALTQAMYTALAEGVTEADTDPAVRVLLLVGSTDAFCAGNDMQDFLSLPEQAAEDNPVLRFMAALANLRKPAVAGVNGLAIGVGLTMLLHCDLVYAGEGTRFQLPFVGIGICPEFASTYLLPRIMGQGRAAELTYFGTPFDAEQAREYGLVNAVLPPAEVDAHALERAGALARQPPAALRTTKQLLKRWNRAEIEKAIRVEAEHFLPMLRGPEALEAITAFMQKRKPDFSRFE